MHFLLPLLALLSARGCFRGSLAGSTNAGAEFVVHARTERLFRVCAATARLTGTQVYHVNPIEERNARDTPASVLLISVGDWEPSWPRLGVGGAVVVKFPIFVVDAAAQRCPGFGAVLALQNRHAILEVLNHLEQLVLRNIHSVLRKLRF